MSHCNPRSAYRPIAKQPVSGVVRTAIATIAFVANANPAAADFPERNITMSALTEATIIVEAGETSGTLIQARAALQQKRKLLILDRCFRNSALSWPGQYLEKGAVRVRDLDEIMAALSL